MRNEAPGNGDIIASLERSSAQQTKKFEEAVDCFTADNIVRAAEQEARVDTLQSNINERSAIII